MASVDHVRRALSIPVNGYDHPSVSEAWIQEQIVKDVSILGLGDLVVKDKERSQPRAGRLDILLQNPDSLKRYEVELQLGPTDERHLIRTIEYWDIERKRYPQYEHCAVIVAEDITSRFLNVISLFNGSIPLIAIQMRAVQLQDKLALIFTTVMDEMKRGFVDEDEEVSEPTDRKYWEEKSGRQALSTADELLKMVQAFAPDHQLTFKRHYIGLGIGASPNNFAVFRPQKNTMSISIALDETPESDRKLDEEELEFKYDKHRNIYVVRVPYASVEKKADLLRDLMKQAYEA